MLRISLLLTTLLAAGAQPSSAAVTYYGPTPYAQRSDSPFAQAIAEGTVRVEDFEDGFLNSGFVTTTCGQITNPTRPSVDEDDGIVDGIGTGQAWTNLQGPLCEFGLFDFRFQPDAFGRLPNFVGFVVVGPASGDFVDGEIVFRAYPSVFDGNGVELSDDRFFSLPTLANISNNSTYYSRFIGFTSNAGIAQLTIGSVTRIDHLQYGYLIPEPSAPLLAAVVLALTTLHRRRPNRRR